MALADGREPEAQRRSEMWLFIPLVFRFAPPIVAGFPGDAVVDLVYSWYLRHGEM